MTDICLILEGTYPYVAGGVSTWVYDLIREFDDLTFSIVYLGAHRSGSRKINYPIPPNVVDFREYYLFDYQVQPERTNPDKKDFALIKDFLLKVRAQDTSSFLELYRLVGQKSSRRLSLYDLAHSRPIWEVICGLYEKEAPADSFLDYFWTFRFIYLPFFSLLRVSLPEARVYHTVSTGYAGVLGALCQAKYNRPLVLTEHGIYTRERKIEIARADWIYSQQARDVKVLEQGDFFREWWVQLFSYFSRLIYERADTIITLFEGNRKIQVEEGADPKKIRIIPNAIDLAAVRSAVRPRPESDGRVRVGFVGRVVPIKDVKTLIIAFRRIKDEFPDAEFYIIGPTDEDEEYFKECRLLAQMESFGEELQFVGKVNSFDYYSRLDLVVLTSISEAQPLVLLEAQALGIPVVATDVGSCRELLNGASPDDKLLGPSGVVTPICDPEATAQAAIKILQDPQLRQKMGAAGKERVEAFYQRKDFVASYRSLYAQYIDEVRW